MFFMLRSSAEMMALAFLAPAFWVGIAGLGIGTYAARRRARGLVSARAAGPALRSTAEVAWLVAVPVLMLAWGLYFWPDHGRGRHEAFALRALDVMALAQLAGCLWLIWGRGGRARPVAGAALAMWWAVGAYLTAGMAVTNTWL